MHSIEALENSAINLTTFLRVFMALYNFMFLIFDLFWFDYILLRGPLQNWLILLVKEVYANEIVKYGTAPANIKLWSNINWKSNIKKWQRAFANDESAENQIEELSSFR